MGPSERKAVRIRPQPRPSERRRVALFTSLEGALLDSVTFGFEPARPVVRRLQEAGVPVIPVSVMTLDEVAPIAASLGLRDAMVLEAGGAMVRWRGGAWEVEPCGPPADVLLDVVRDIEDRSGASLLVYSALPAEEAARLSGRSGEMLQASTHRCFSEPFVIESGDLDAVQRAAADAGFSVRRGRRFLHLCRECDEGEAFARLRDELRCEVAIGVGSAAVDAEFLARTDIPIIVPGADGEPDEELLAAVPTAHLAPEPGPRGWAAAVSEVWQGLGMAKPCAARRAAR